MRRLRRGWRRWGLLFEVSVGVFFLDCFEGRLSSSCLFIGRDQLGFGPDIVSPDLCWMPRCWTFGYLAQVCRDCEWGRVWLIGCNSGWDLKLDDLLSFR